MENVPWHEEVVDFVQQLERLLRPNYAIASEHAHSNCVLLAHTKVQSASCFFVYVFIFHCFLQFCDTIIG